jgi:hypothetical protein
VTWALLVLASLAACELLVRFSVLDRIHRAAVAAGCAGRLIVNPAVSDHWKERALRRYALRMGSASLEALAIVVVACLPFIALAFAAPLFEANIIDSVLSWEGLLSVAAGASAYSLLHTLVRRRGGTVTWRGTASAADEVPTYPPLARLLHRLVLSAPEPGRLLFDIECATAPPVLAGAAEGRHVYVVGLARAGSTVLMRAIHDSAAFASLTYRDMPFVMAPNLWARLSVSFHRNMAKVERAHGDGVLIDFDSPEALEEPFWRTFCGVEYIRSNALVPHEVDTATIDRYRAFVDHVLARYGATRYLAKNNNNIQRLPALRAAFPNAIVLIPFRAPCDQSLSLQRQHARFCAAGDGFTRRYMSWLAHHEFGPDHRPFVFDSHRYVGGVDGINYWLSMWVAVHRHLLSQVDCGGADLVPIAYEDLCGPNRASWRAICARIGIAPSEPNFAKRKADIQAPGDRHLLAEADALYERLRALSRARLGWKAGVPLGPCCHQWVSRVASVDVQRSRSED